MKNLITSEHKEIGMKVLEAGRANGLSDEMILENFGQAILAYIEMQDKVREMVAMKMTVQDVL
jgi:hypothetical protein